MPTSTPAPDLPPTTRWARWGAGVLALALAAGALAYLLTPYAALRDWYLGRTPNLYRAATWSRDFFTPAVKAQGNWFCLGGLALLAVGLVWWALPRLRPAFLRKAPLADYSLDPKPPLVARADWPYLGGLLVVAAGLWGLGAAQLPPAYDEVFSAVYSAGSGSVFVAWSYYMLPNNHLLFNVLNGGLFGWLGQPTVLLTTGRVLSGLAYVATVGVIYRTLRGLTGYRILAAGLALLAALQYAIWGFGCQARGYALYALMHWLAVASLLGYWQRPTAGRRWGNAVAVAVGYATVPTFLFYHVAQLLAVATVQLRRRQPDGQFWWAQANALGASYWFYLPALCFSGLKALSDNQYVRPHQGPLAEFVVKYWPKFLNYTTYCFGYGGPDYGLSYVLVLLPLVLLVWPRPAAAASQNWPWRLALLYAFWLLALVAGTLKLHLLLFPRNALALFSMALVLGVLAPGLLLRRWRRWAGTAVMLALGIGLGARFVRHNPVQDPSGLYNSKVLRDYQLGLKRIATLPPSGTRAFSEESFYPYFLSLQAGQLAAHPAHRPLAADYFITAPNGRLPLKLAPLYQPVDTVGGYRLYRRLAEGAKK
jgi:hypothetical protein